MRIVAVIPARTDSKRFPNKVLQCIDGIPMVEYVRRRVLLSKCFDSVYIATPDDEVSSLIKGFNGLVIETSKDHQSGTSRVGEAITNIDCSHVVIIQGDEPLIIPEYLKSLTNKIKEQPNIQAWNLISSIDSYKELIDESNVKCSINIKSEIIYAYRKIPSIAELNIEIPYIRKLMGVMAYKKNFLNILIENKESRIDIIENIEQLKIIEMGINIQGVEVETDYQSVNTKEDYVKMLQTIDNNKKQQKYHRMVHQAK